MTRARSFFLIVLALFAIYIVITAPTQSADLMRNAISGLGSILGQLGSFFSTLFGG